MKVIAFWTAVIALLGLGILALPSRAEAADARPVVTIDPPVPVVVGVPPVITAHLATASGQPIAGALLKLYVDDKIAASAGTDETGAAVLRIKRDLDAGQHDVLVTFDGDPRGGLQPAAADARLPVQQGTVEVQTVPPLPGLEIRFAPAFNLTPWSASQVVLMTDEQGIARLPVDRIGMYRLELLPFGDRGGFKVTFARWQDNVYTPFRVFTYAPGLHLQAGFDSSYLVTQRFTDLAGAPVDPSLVTSFTLKSSTGQRLKLPDGTSRWLPGGRIVKRKHGLEVTPLYYSVEEVIVDGTNVVNRAQHRFVPSTEQEWTIPLLFYSMRLVAKDALFRFPIGDTVRIVAPDGSVHDVPLAADGTATILALPRGHYTVRVLGSGYSPPSPVALSRNQVVELKVISYIDLAAVAGAGVITAISLLFVGRRDLVLFPFHVARSAWRMAAVRPTRSVGP